MKKRIIQRLIVTVCMAAGFLVGLSLWAKVSFRARMYSSIAGAPPVNIKIDIDEYSPSDEIQKLSEALNKGDENGFYRLLRGMNKGSIQFIGGLGMNIKLNTAQEHSTDKGIKIVLLTESRSVEPGSTRMKNIPWRFLVVILDLDKNFNGEGLIYEDAMADFMPQGIIDLGSSFSAPKTLVNVRLVK
jgi:hypothetical protein